jgi:hypothetical protein
VRRSRTGVSTPSREPRLMGVADHRRVMRDHPAAVCSGVSGRSTQNSLPSGSVITTHLASAPCPTSARRAPSPSSRATSAA